MKGFCLLFKQPMFPE